MNQTNPPNQGEQDPNNPYASQDAQDQYAGQQASNPYNYQRTAPNLDANAPALTSNELQRINRKAMFFLGGIVLFLLVAAAWMFSSASSGDKEAVKPAEETITAPKLPDAPANEEPVQLADQQPILLAPPQLPPPPDEGFFKPDPKDEAPPLANTPRGPTLAERRMMDQGNNDASGSGIDPSIAAVLAAQGRNATAGTFGGDAAEASGKNKSESAAATKAEFLTNADSLLVRGTYIRCVLETRIITDIPGFASCVVTEPIYSINGRRLLLPKGSKVSGSYDTEDPKFPRVSVIWDRVTTPNGIDVTMASPGVDNLGSAGHPGQYNAHWASKLSSALLISLVSDAFKYAGEKNGPQSQAVTSGGQVVTQPYDSNTAKTMQKFADQVVERNLARPATVTINQGTVVNIYVAKDVSFARVVAP
jgi:type IV secretion system protein VirB10